MAETILHCAQTPERDVIVGGGGKGIVAAGSYAPRLMDWMQERTMFRQQKTARPAHGPREGILNRPSHQLAERGDLPRHVFEHSAYTAASLHPLIAGAAVVGAGLALGALWEGALAGRETRPGT